MTIKKGIVLVKVHVSEVKVLWCLMRLRIKLFSRLFGVMLVWDDLGLCKFIFLALVTCWQPSCGFCVCCHKDPITLTYRPALSHLKLTSSSQNQCISPSIPFTNSNFSLKHKGVIIYYQAPTKKRASLYTIGRNPSQKTKTNKFGSQKNGGPNSATTQVAGRVTEVFSSKTSWSWKSFCRNRLKGNAEDGKFCFQLDLYGGQGRGFSYC